MTAAVCVSAVDSDSGYFLSATASAIWKSTDGTTWALSQAVAGVTRLWIDRAQVTVAYAGCSDGSVYRSMDSGATWVLMGTVGAEVTYLISEPTNYASLYVGAGNYLYHSANSGASFVTVKDFGAAVSDAALQAATHLSVALGTTPFISRSIDSGVTWQNATFSGSGIAFDAITTGPFSPDNSIAAGGTEVWAVESSISGQDAYAKIGDLVGAVQRLHYDNQLVSILYAGTATGLEKSLDDGVTWGTIYSATAVNDFAMGRLGIPVVYTKTGFAWVSESDRIEIFSASGVLSTTIMQGVSDLHVSGAKAIGLYWTGAVWRLWRTDDGGATSSNYSVGLTAGDSGVLGVSADYQTILAGFVRASDCWLYRSTDGGQNWSQVYTYNNQSTNGSWFPRAFVTLGSTFIMGTGNPGTSDYVIRESADGLTWGDTFAQPSYDPGVHVLAVTPGGTTAYAGKSSSAQGSAFFRRIGGTWTAMTADPTWLWWTALAANMNDILVGRASNGGNAYSTDGGATWTPIDAGQLSVAIIDVESDPETTGDFYAIQNVVGDQQIKKSTDGITWTKFCDLNGNGVNVQVVRV